MLTTTQATHLEFCIRESAMHTRGAWGVFKIFVITYRRELVAEGVFPVEDASRVVIGQVFRAEGVNTLWNGKPRLKLLSVQPRDGVTFAAIQQLACQGVSLRGKVQRLLKKMTDDELISALAAPIAKGQPCALISKHKVRPAAAKELRAAYEATSYAHELQAKYPVLPAHLLAKLTREQCAEVKRDPYTICTFLEEEMGRMALLKLADQMAVAGGEWRPLAHSRIARHIAGAIHEACELSGSFWVREDELVGRTVDTLGAVHHAEDGPIGRPTYGAEVNAVLKGEAAYAALIERATWADGVERVALRWKALLERRLATSLLRMLDGGMQSAWAPYALRLARAIHSKGASAAEGGRDLAYTLAVEGITRMRGCEEQWEALQLLLTRRVSLLSGLAGCGKSTVTATVAALLHASREVKVVLVAPTGKAAQRLTQLCRGRGTANTVHSMLVRPEPLGTETKPAYWIFDETAMVGCGLMDRALAFAAKGSRSGALFVGDPAQLAAFGDGAGRAFLDMIESGVFPHAQLRHVHRQAEGGAIVEAANAVARREMPPESGDGWRLVDAEAPEHHGVELVQLVLAQVRALHASTGVRPAVICQTNAAAHALNRAMQLHFNAAHAARGCPLLYPGAGPPTWAVGDPVIHKHNVYNAKRERELANGTAGSIYSVSDKGVQVTFQDALCASRYFHKREAALDLRFGYAATVHSSQGCEHAATVVVLDNVARFQSVESLYSAVTRGKRAVTLVASGSKLRAALAQSDRANRCTRLTQLLRKEGGAASAANKRAAPPA